MPYDLMERMPHNQEAEQGLLGCLLVSNETYHEISPIIDSGYFHIPAHQRIFEALAQTINAGKNASPITLKNTFENDPDLPPEYLAELAGSIISVVNAKDYAASIKELYHRRELVRIANTILARASDYSLSHKGEVLSEAESAITALSDNRTSNSFTAAEAVQKARLWSEGVRSGKIKPFVTGLPSLDDKIAGLYPGRLYILAGRPGMGKTALGLNFADNISKDHPALFISLEMPAEEIGLRLDASRTGIPMGRLQGKAPLGAHEQIGLQESMNDIVTRKLTIEDSAGIDVHGIKSLARKHKRKHGKFVLLIDYLGLISTDPAIKNKVHQIEEITTNLKRLSKELDIPVVLLCQLSRAVEGRDDKRPALSDLRDSGSIEQDADVVMFIYREEYYADRQPPARKPKESQETYSARLLDYHDRMDAVKGKAEIIVAKNRQGTSGSVIVNFNGIKQRFFE